jgi:hypothetical protein
MRYDKPEVIKVANAVNAIQSGEKAIVALDSDGTGSSLQTTSAYEADE